MLSIRLVNLRRQAGHRREDRVISRTLRAALAAIVVCALPVSLQGQAPAGYALMPAVSLPDCLIESRTGGMFRIEVVRIASDSAARRALILAESAFPDSQAIGKAAAGQTLEPVQRRLQRAARLPGPRWWWDEFDGVLTPYAVTGAAVDYYVSRLRARSEITNPFKDFSEGRAHNGSFSYRATVTAAPSDGPGAGGHIVRTTLRWQYWCGMLCAVRFAATREVLISREGRILYVRGDGPPVLVVS